MRLTTTPHSVTVVVGKWHLSAESRCGRFQRWASCRWGVLCVRLPLARVVVTVWRERAGVTYPARRTP